MATSNGTLRVYILTKLHIAKTMQQVNKEGLEAKRNFRRNMIAKVNAIPVIEA